MKNQRDDKMSCPLCKEEVYSELGQGCKMCGMSLENKEDEFCSKICKINYIEINHDN